MQFRPSLSAAIGQKQTIHQLSKKSQTLIKEINMPATAAAQYWTQRRRYRAALGQIAAIDDEDIRQALRQALTVWIRGKFRGISTALTTRMGCRLSCLPVGYEGQIHVEHAVPLKMIHNQILGIHFNGAVDQNIHNILSTPKDIEAYVRAFVIGVLVSPQQHSLLDPQSMNAEWNWLADIPPWDWNNLSLDDWNYDTRPSWMRLIMHRYEHVPPPQGPIKYRPI
jgi:hypothetical protein